MSAPWVLACVLGFPSVAGAAELDERPPLDLADVPLSALLEMSLDEYLAAGFVIASLEPMTVRESPSVVTVVTHDEIVSTGARDLIDILNLVAGFSPLVDSESNFNVGFRGVINEGKVLLTIDGQPMNEVFYNSLRLVPRYPIDQIERIEIVRGPGSVIYGGQAEMGVINVVTRGPSTQDGVALAGTGGVFLGGSGRRLDLSASYADVFEKLGDLSTSLGVYVGSASHSAFRYTDFAGDSYVLADQNSRYEPLFVNFGASFQGLNLRLIHDGFRGFHRDVFSESEPTAYELHDRGTYAQLDYGWELSDRLTITPLVRYQQQQPWNVVDPASSAHFDKTADVSFASLSAAWDPIDALDVLIGGEGSLTRGWLNSEAFTGLQTPLAGGDRLQFTHVGAFAQGVSESVLGNLTAGARFEHHSEVGESFVPRLAWTRIFGNFHAKLMGSGAFRAPSIENVSLATDPGQTRPEKVRALEAEAGLQLNEYAWVVVNAFDVTIDDPIVYVLSTDPVTDEPIEGYANYQSLGTRGVEVEARLKARRAWLNLNYSFYTNAGKGSVPNYAVPGRSDVLLGTPKHKVVAYGAAGLTEELWASANAVFLSERHGYVDATVDPGGELLPVAGSVDPGVLLGGFLTLRDTLAPGLDLQLGVQNILDTRLLLMPAYDGLHPPTPVQSREALLTVRYDGTRSTR